MVRGGGALSPCIVAKSDARDARTGATDPERPVAFVAELPDSGRSRLDLRQPSRVAGQAILARASRKAVTKAAYQSMRWDVTDVLYPDVRARILNSQGLICDQNLRSSTRVEAPAKRGAVGYAQG